jgi:hypothetical protein
MLPAPAVDPKWVASRIENLNSDVFAVREQATRKLAELGELARTSMRTALADNPPVETRRRLEGLLGRLNQVTPLQLRTLRTIEILEGIGTPEALQVIDQLTQGNPDALATAESRRVAVRMKTKK